MKSLQQTSVYQPCDGAKLEREDESKYYEKKIGQRKYYKTILINRESFVTVSTFQPLQRHLQHKLQLSSFSTA